MSAKTAPVGHDARILQRAMHDSLTKLAPHIPAMRASIAKALGIDDTQVNVKAKTAEKMGPVGQGAAMEARAVVLLVRAA